MLKILYKLLDHGVSTEGQYNFAFLYLFHIKFLLPPIFCLLVNIFSLMTLKMEWSSRQERYSIKGIWNTIFSFDTPLHTRFAFSFFNDIWDGFTWNSMVTGSKLRVMALTWNSETLCMEGSVDTAPPKCLTLAKMLAAACSKVLQCRGLLACFGCLRWQINRNLQYVWFSFSSLHYYYICCFIIWVPQFFVLLYW